MAKERLHFIDMARAIAIIAMVTLHVEMAIEYTLPTSAIVKYSNLQYYLFLSWNMLLCFLVTGYCSNYQKPFKPFFTTLALSTGLPIFFFDIIPVNYDNFTTMPLDEAIANIPWSLFRLFRYSFWFLRALFVAKMIYWILCKFTNGLTKITLIVLLYLIACFAVVNGHGAHGCHSLIALSFIAIGDWIKKQNMLFNDKFCYACIVIHITCMLGMWWVDYLPPTFTETLEMNYFDIIWLPIVALSGSVSIFYLCKIIKRCWALEYVGKYTLVIYCFHYFVNKWLNLHSLLNADSSLLYSLLILTTNVIITVTLCCIFAYIVDRPYLRVIIGKKP